MKTKEQIIQFLQYHDYICLAQNTYICLVDNKGLMGYRHVGLRIKNNIVQDLNKYIEGGIDSNVKYIDIPYIEGELPNSSEYETLFSQYFVKEIIGILGNSSSFGTFVNIGRSVKHTVSFRNKFKHNNIIKLIGTTVTSHTTDEIVLIGNHDFEHIHNTLQKYFCNIFLTETYISKDYKNECVNLFWNKYKLYEVKKLNINRRINGLESMLFIARINLDNIFLSILTNSIKNMPIDREYIELPEILVPYKKAFLNNALENYRNKKLFNNTEKLIIDMSDKLIVLDTDINKFIKQQDAIGTPEIYWIDENNSLCSRCANNEYVIRL
jgi:hypothetical protein